MAFYVQLYQTPPPPWVGSPIMRLTFLMSFCGSQNTWWLCEDQSSGKSGNVPECLIMQCLIVKMSNPKMFNPKMSKRC